MTDKRIDFLIKAKQSRNEKKSFITVRNGEVSPMRAGAWAANANLDMSMTQGPGPSHRINPTLQRRLFTGERAEPDRTNRS